MLTDAQEQQIESVESYTHNYEAEAMQSFEATGNDKMERLDLVEGVVVEDVP